MRQVVDSNGTPITGLYRRADDSLVVVDDAAFMKNKISHEAFDALNMEVMTLKRQIEQILGMLNGRN
jgi:translation initiation factor 6 (eIF-6)